MKRYENKAKKPTSILLKKSKKLPLNINEIDIDLIMSNPKTIHKFMGKDNGQNECEFEKPNYYKEDLFNTTLPEQGQQFRLENDKMDKENVGGWKELINEFISRKEFDNVREHLKKKPKKAEGKALNELLDRPSVHDFIHKYYEYKTRDKSNEPGQKIIDYMTSTKKDKL